MTSETIGQKYDKIAAWWNDYHSNSNYGVQQFERALAFTTDKGTALDVGCGSNERFINRLKARGFHVTGIDASKKMVELARAHHPEMQFIDADIRDWSSNRRFDFIYSWTCLFHLPLEAQEPVLRKLCQRLSPGGVLLYDFGGGEQGAHEDLWHDMVFPYSTLGINENLRILMEEGLEILHLEHDQLPEKHVYVVARRMQQR